MTTVHTEAIQALEIQEEMGRAEIYGLLATLLSAPPSQQFLDDVAATSAPGSAILEQAWAALADTCRSAQAEAVRVEYELLFVGVGRPEVMLYGSYYLSGFMMEKPLAALRTDLASLGLERPESVVESEDHIAILCEVMRHLILAEDAALANIDTQRIFFRTHMQTWLARMCQEIEGHRHADFYRPVARLAARFFEIETQAFDMQ